MASVPIVLPCDTLATSNSLANTFVLTKPHVALANHLRPQVDFSSHSAIRTITRASDGARLSGDARSMQIHQFSFKRISVSASRRGRLMITRADAMVAEAESYTSPESNIDVLKSELLRRVAGLDRGLAATDKDAEEVEVISRNLERNGRSVELPEDLVKLQGCWRLAYSSAFLSGSLGGQRPGPPIGRLPITLGQVYQTIDAGTRGLDNVVTLQLGTPWPLPSVEVTATLAHTLETFGKAGIRIIFEKTSVKGEGPLKDFPTLTIPQLPEFLRPPSGLRSGEFETTYLDDDLRVSRGDRGELRIFVKA